MTQICPYCQQSDIAEGARKCHYCGSWLDETQRLTEFEEFRRETRAELSDDLDKHRAVLETLLKRMQNVAVVVIVAVSAVSAFFGFRTDTSLSDIKKEYEVEMQRKLEVMDDKASAKVNSTTDSISKKSVETIEKQVAEKLSPGKVQVLITEAVEDNLTVTVGREVEKSINLVRKEVDAEVATATAILNTTKEELKKAAKSFEDIKQQTGKLTQDFSVFNERLENAQRSEVRTLEALLPVEPVEMAGKSGLRQLDDLIERRVNAISFILTVPAYNGPASWLYLTRLRGMPEFKYVVLLDGNDRHVVGIFDADMLALALNPPDSQALAEKTEANDWKPPPPESVGDWNFFVDWVNKGKIDKLIGLPSFQLVGEPVPRNATSLSALDLMEKQGADVLPVVNRSGKFVGLLERSRLTTRMLLEIAKGSGN